MVLLMNKDYSFDELGALAFASQMNEFQEQLSILHSYYERLTLAQKEYFLTKCSSLFLENLMNNWGFFNRTLEPNLSVFRSCNLLVPPAFDDDESLNGELEVLRKEHFEFSIQEKEGGWTDLDYVWPGTVDSFLTDLSYTYREGKYIHERTPPTWGDNESLNRELEILSKEHF